jgi:anhydro-N-acetylmuramic acid kinase
MSHIWALGLMSGTSMDGIDLAAVGTDGELQVERGPSLFIPYEAPFRRRIEAALADAKHITERTRRPGDLAALEMAMRSMRSGARIQISLSIWWVFTDRPCSTAPSGR